MKRELPTQYDPNAVEAAVYDRWLSKGAFHASPDERDERYVIMMPLPNVTGALHMGHAMDNVMQDLLTRWHRMRGENALWMAGTDHAGIATQAVVEKRLLELEGRTRNDVGREALVARIHEWKDQYQARIVSQQQAMGCSCDWDRQRFTLDEVCVLAVRRTFFELFRDGLIYRGTRLVNQDCHLGTAVSDDEVYHEKVAGHFWHLRYDVIDPQPGEPDHVIVATTRPETMLGDTAVACHPDPGGRLDQLIAEARERVDASSDKERSAAEAELQALEERRASHLEPLDRLAAMARDGRRVMLPLQERPIPLITDEWAKPELGSGCVKITPAHDPNDYEVWKRHEDEIGIVNLLEPDGTYNQLAGEYAGLDRFEVRRRVVADLEAAGLLPRIEGREIEVGHSDRSKTPIEPYVSMQWFVRMGDLPGGVTFGRGTDKEFQGPGLAQAAMDAVGGEWRSKTGRSVVFHPDGERYSKTYLEWLREKRDWCISRQLWWGHRIPIWHGSFASTEIAEKLAACTELAGRDDIFVRVSRDDGQSWPADAGIEWTDCADNLAVQVCLLGEDAESAAVEKLAALGLEQDPDVLDTWFSSGLWPHSTLGWPDPAKAPVLDGQSPLSADGEHPSCLDYYYPGSCLVTGRDIITLWVARMVLMGLYNLGDVPFTDVFIHATILDGRGVRMSKSKGNGIDPVDIIERYGADAMRYVICEMQTGVQDVRLPVHAISPFTGKTIDLAKAKNGRSIFTYLCPETKQEFDVLGTLPDLPAAKLFSERFEVGRNFANKLLNATRFALLNLEGVRFEPRALADLEPEDRWVLSRLVVATEALVEQLEAYNPAAAISVAREFFWSELCDWYLELIKPRLRDAPESGSAAIARQVLATCVDQVLRLLHPFVPFITEYLWEHLAEIAPERGVDELLAVSEQLVVAPWPAPRREWIDTELETRFELLQEITRAIREKRSQNGLPPGKKLPALVKASSARRAELEPLGALLSGIAGLESLSISEDVERTSDSAVAVVGDLEIFLPGAIDLEKEKAKLAKQRDQLAGRIGGIEKKLANPGFLAKAPDEVVAREKERIEELRVELQVVESNLIALG